ELRSDQYLGSVLGNLQIRYRTDYHIFVANLGLADFEPFGGLEADGDRRAGMQPSLHQQRSADRGRDQRDQPDPGDARFATRLHVGLASSGVPDVGLMRPGLWPAARMRRGPAGGGRSSRLYSLAACCCAAYRFTRWRIRFGICHTCLCKLRFTSRYWFGGIPSRRLYRAIMALRLPIPAKARIIA